MKKAKFRAKDILTDFLYKSAEFEQKTELFLNFHKLAIKVKKKLQKFI